METVETTQIVIGFVLAGLTIGGTLVGFLAWQAKRERKLLLSEVREEMRTTVNGKIDSANEKLDSMSETTNEKLDQIRDEATSRHINTETRLAQGAANFDQIRRDIDQAAVHRSRIEERIDKLAGSH